MSLLKVSSINDLTDTGGFSLSNGGVTATLPLVVGNIVINGAISGNSGHIIPRQAGNAEKLLQTDGSNLSWVEAAGLAGIRSMNVWTGNGTWNRPSDCTSIMVTAVGAGGGGSGYCEAGGAGGMSQRVIDVTNVSSVSVTVGNPGGGTNYAGCGGNGNSSSFGSYVTGGGGGGSNCIQQHEGGLGGEGIGGTLNVFGGGGNAHGSHHSYGNHAGGASYYGGSQPSSHRQGNYSHRHEGHSAWGAGGNGSQHGNRGASGRQGVVVVHEYYGKPASADTSYGTSSGNPAESAEEIKIRNPNAGDGVYWINFGGTVRQIYCLMDNRWLGGGWMMGMKATRGTTFNWDSSYWTSNNVLNESSYNTNDGDAKFETMNKFAAKDILGIWPDIGNGGCVPDTNRGWTWFETDFNTGYGRGGRIVPITFWSQVDRFYKSNANEFCGIGQFSGQSHVRFYGFNYRNNPGWARTRWGFGWNENGGGSGGYPEADMNSDDVSGGIGMSGNFGSYSAGDRINCCQNRNGINRSARIELYFR